MWYGEWAGLACSRTLGAMSKPGRRPSVLSHLAVMAVVAAILGVLVAGLAIPFAGVVGVAAKDVSKGMVKLPDELEAKELAQKTRIYDANGNLIASLYDQNRINVGLQQISRKMVEAIVSIEDDRYYQHGALDIRGTIRAFVTNQASGSVQGGSSITQQMVKQTLLNQAETKEEAAAATDDTYARKLRELRYAIAFEKNYSKDWILERYLNIAYFGDGAYGIQSAAQHYFSKNAKNLNYLQSATLAGLVKNPTGYDPTNSPERSINRRNVVLDRMAQLNVIPQEQADKLKERPLGLKVDPVAQRLPAVAGAVLLRLRRQLPPQGQVARRDRQGPQAPPPVRRPDDPHHARPRLPGRCRRRPSQAHVNPTDQAIGGLAMVEPGTGYVRALAQSRPMGKDKAVGETYLNYVVPAKYGDANGFQAGSTFKAFVLAAAINQNIPLSESIYAPQRDEHPGRGVRDLRRSLRRRRRGLGGLELDGRRPELQPLHRHPAVGEHLLRPARGRDRHVRADRARREDGHQAARHPAGAVVDPRRLRHQPAHDGRGLRHLRRPRQSTATRSRSPRSWPRTAAR